MTDTKQIDDIAKAFIAAEVARVQYAEALDAVRDGAIGDASDAKAAYESATAAARAAAGPVVASQLAPSRA